MKINNSVMLIVKITSCIQNIDENLISHRSVADTAFDIESTDSSTHSSLSHQKYPKDLLESITI